MVKSKSSAPLDEGLNPGPVVELDFWTAKYTNLKCLFDQLSDKRVQKVSQILELSHSTYYPAFRSIFAEVETGRQDEWLRNQHLSFIPIRHHTHTASSGRGKRYQLVPEAFPRLRRPIVIRERHGRSDQDVPPDGAHHSAVIHALQVLPHACASVGAVS